MVAPIKCTTILNKTQIISQQYKDSVKKEDEVKEEEDNEDKEDKEKTVYQSHGDVRLPPVGWQRVVVPESF